MRARSTAAMIGSPAFSERGRARRRRRRRSRRRDEAERGGSGRRHRLGVRRSSPRRHRLRSSSPGTSMATPHVSGLRRALLLQANPSLTPLQRAARSSRTPPEHNHAQRQGDRRPRAGSVRHRSQLRSELRLGTDGRVRGAPRQALNSTSGVQVVQIRAIAEPASGAHRLPMDHAARYSRSSGSARTARPTLRRRAGLRSRSLNAHQSRPPATRTSQASATARTTLYVDAMPGLVDRPAVPGTGSSGWISRAAASRRAAGAGAATARWRGSRPPTAQIAHNAVDNDLLCAASARRSTTTPASLGDADFEVLGPGRDRPGQRTRGPADTRRSGQHRHLDDRNRRALVGRASGKATAREPYLPPASAHPWFLSREGREATWTAPGA